MATQSAASHNPALRSSGKNVRFSALPLAAKVARELAVVPSWPNLQIIRLAIESAAHSCHATLAETAEMLIRAGKEWTARPQYHCPSEWEIREIERLNTIDRFWFEDARWRGKVAYERFYERLRQDREQTA